MSESLEFPSTIPTTPPTMLFPAMEIETTSSSSEVGGIGDSSMPLKRESIIVPASVPTMFALTL